MLRRLILPIVMIAVTLGCGMLGGGGQEAANDLPTATPFELPTFTPTATQSLPTPTMTSAPPTQIPSPTVAATQAGEATEESGGEAQPTATTTVGRGISIDPALGEPGQNITVDGSGTNAGTIIPLYWADLDGENRIPAGEVTADADGEFTAILTVPDAEDWPGGPAEEGDFIRVEADFPNEPPFWANFRYVVVFNPENPVLTYTSDTFGYSVTVFDGWTWDSSDERNVRFNSPTGSGAGFVRVIDSTDVSAVINTVMSEEAPGESYTTAEAGVGQYAGQQATTTNGRIYLFVPSGDRVYALSFIKDSGENAINILGTFTLP